MSTETFTEGLNYALQKEKNALSAFMNSISKSFNNC